jgi:predicted DNA-binding protein (UPF0251 family)/DNA-directed RNA polymerase subunit N (RpoN/RPB10)
MARPRKWRRVEFIPTVQHFVPLDMQSDTIEESILKVEEIEAIRLRDTEDLEQEQCAERMEVSRQTFQRILGSARKKLADAIINGKAIKIEGGNYTRHICPVRCLDCGSEWQESYENFKKIMSGAYECPECQSNRLMCFDRNRQKFCRRNCWRGGR